ncbi:hypothetical protein M0812_16730 [Anaeramoeba flamelloides]|uniref:Uncharacterized protein n=1 Tax=Anaeramoeba flamelloides TaxID=1746091 RepID=A0AAV7ZB38_9EUKA|nr:hypothetical protein M0812_16730 [Anaeramoeba flamelloides]
MSKSISILKQSKKPKKKSISWDESNLKEIEKLQQSVFCSSNNEILNDKNLTEIKEVPVRDFFQKQHTKRFLAKRKKYKEHQKEIRTQRFFVLDEPEQEMKEQITKIKKYYQKNEKMHYLN